MKLSDREKLSAYMGKSKETKAFTFTAEILEEEETIALYKERAEYSRKEGY